MLVRIVMLLDDEVLEKRLRRLLKRDDVLLTSLAGSELEVARLERESPDLLIITRHLLKEPLLPTMIALRRLPEEPEVLVMRELENAAERAHLLAAGVCAVACTEVADAALAELLARQIERRVQAMLSLLDAAHGARQVRLMDFVSASSAMHAFVQTVYQVTDADTTLLILGETGVGKEHLARGIHAESRRASGPFIAVNCGALPEHLLESELFGHEEGAFTGASRAVRGQFELAHRGTLFLDEIGDMPVHLQVKLLHVLERRQIRRVGGERVIDIDVRILAATNRNLGVEIAANRFRQDLFYRLSAVALTIPPLRERREDVPELIANYLRHFRVAMGRDVREVAPSAVAALQRYDWPGNVRELINVVERAVLLSSGPVVGLADLPPAIAGTVAGSPFTPTAMAASDTVAVPVLSDQPLSTARTTAVAVFEHAYVSQVLRKTGGRVGEAARLAGITPRALYDRMRHLGLRKEDFRDR